MSGLSFHGESDTLRREEKKVEYLELIYDLIFVYIIGRNNSLLHHVENGFVPAAAFLAYVLCSLAVRTLCGVHFPMDLPIQPGKGPRRGIARDALIERKAKL